MTYLMRSEEVIHFAHPRFELLSGHGALGYVARRAAWDAVVRCVVTVAINAVYPVRLGGVLALFWLGLVRRWRAAVMAVGTHECIRLLTGKMPINVAQPGTVLRVVIERVERGVTGGAWATLRQAAAALRVAIVQNLGRLDYNLSTDAAAPPKPVAEFVPAYLFQCGEVCEYFSSKVNRFEASIVLHGKRYFAS